MVHFEYSRGAKLLTHKGIFIKEKNILGCHQVFFFEVWRPFLASLCLFLPSKNISSYPF